MSKVRRFGSQLGWQKHNLRWPSAFPARAKQVELLSGSRGTGPQKGQCEWEVEQWEGQTDKQGHRSRFGWLAPPT